MIHFRLAERADIDSLRRIFAEDAISYDPYAIRQFLDEPTTQLYLAMDDYEVIGFASAHLQLRPDGEVNQQIERLFVSRSRRLHGIGTEFLNYICEDARRIGCRKTILSTDLKNGAAKKLFAKFKGDQSELITFDITY